MAKGGFNPNSRNYNNNKVYPTGGVTGKREKDMNYGGIRPAPKKGPQPTDMGSTSGRGQTKRFYKGPGKEGN